MAWRWLLLWLLVLAVLDVAIGPESQVSLAYFLLTAGGVLYLWVPWARRLRPLAHELQDASDAYTRLDELLAELVAAGSVRQERLPRLDALNAERRAIETRLDDVLGRWPRNPGFVVRVFPAWGRDLDKAYSDMQRGRQRTARIYDLLAEAIVQSDLSTVTVEQTGEGGAT